VQVFIIALKKAQVDGFMLPDAPKNGTANKVSNRVKS
jgi:hypothetical protein